MMAYVVLCEMINAAITHCRRARRRGIRRAVW